MTPDDKASKRRLLLKERQRLKASGPAGAADCGCIISMWSFSQRATVFRFQMWSLRRLASPLANQAISMSLKVVDLD